VKVLVISHSMVVAHYQQRLFHLAKYLKDLVLVVPEVYKEAGQWVKLGKLNSPDYRIIKSKAYFKVKNYLYFIPSIFKVISSFKPDIIDIMEEPFSFQAFLTILGIKLTRKNITPVIFTAENKLRTYPFPFSFFRKFVLKNVKGVYPVSKEAEEVLRKSGYKGYTCVIPLGVDIGFFKNMRRYSIIQKVRKQFFNNYYVIGFAGRLTHQKGIVNLIEAILELKRVHKDCCLFIAGTGELKAHIKKVKEEAVLYGGFFRHSQMPVFYNLLDLLVIPSDLNKEPREQFGRVGIEAMACEVPVIATSIRGLKEALCPAACFIPTNSKADIINGILKVKSNKDLQRKMIKRGNELVVRRYSWKAIVNLQFQFYLKSLKALQM